MSFLSELEKVLKSDERFIGEDNQIIKTKVSDAAMGTDGLLIKSLLQNELLRDSFFTKVDDVYVFDKVKFIWVLESKEFLPDSYTLYKNKIGLVDNQNNLNSKKQDVTLVWPYKDCVLEGDQTKENQKREEIFYNEILAPDEVNRLLAPKVLGNAKRYGVNGIEEDVEFDKNDNLIIKGNNLLGLTSLLEKYESQIQLIYIDPPFNTGKDSFEYNDRFNHSTWLTFMKNRLVIAKRLLKQDGSILVHLDFNESHYAKVLLDEVFGNECFKNNIVWCYTGPSGSTRFLPRKHDDILFYGNSENIKFNQPFVKHKSGVHNTGQVFGKTESSDYFKEKAEEQGKKLEDWWDDIYSTDRYRSELLDFSGQKPEKLLQRIIEMTTDEGDIVLDYHLGSGTTAAVAHKLGRKYIGIEQMEGQIDIELDRLQKVIDGYGFGISKDVNWQGGGSFVYCELLEDNQSLIYELEQAQDSNSIKFILDKATQNGKIVHSVLPSDLKRTEDEFESLSLDEQKKVVLELLDKNKLYINLSDMEDEDASVSDADKAFTKSFYGLD
jgi:DNA methylase N-4/N-6 domain protein